MNKDNGGGVLTFKDLPAKMSRLKIIGENLTEEQRVSLIRNMCPNLDDQVDFEPFLKVSFSRFFWNSLL